jgi:ParB family chromosome partitioning protein
MEESIHQLAENIREHGLITPIVVQKTADNRYQLINGQRRIEVYKRLGHEQIPASISNRELNPLEAAIIASCQEEDLNPIDLAESLLAMQEKLGRNQEEIGKIIGKEQSSVSEYLSIATLPPDFKDEYRQSPEIQKNATRYKLVQIARAKDENVRTQMWNALREGRSFSVDQMRKLREKPAAAGTPTVRELVAVKNAIKKLVGVDEETLEQLAADADYKVLVALQKDIADLLKKTKALRDARRHSKNAPVDSEHELADSAS